ncbi:hypothetical protein ACNEO8_004718, partial [Escherichia coli]
KPAFFILPFIYSSCCKTYLLKYIIDANNIKTLFVTVIYPTKELFNVELYLYNRESLVKLMLSFIVKNPLISCNIKEKTPRKRTVTDKNTDHQFIISP